MNETLSPPHQISIARGNIYLSREVCDLYFKGIENVALLAHEAGLLIIPLVQDAAGGSLLKVKNLRGDRVIHAQEFWRQQGYSEEFEERFYSVRWEANRAALFVSGSFSARE
jgi:hypothetical protein